MKSASIQIQARAFRAAGASRIHVSIAQLQGTATALGGTERANHSRTPATASCGRSPHGFVSRLTRVDESPTHRVPLLALYCLVLCTLATGCAVHVRELVQVPTLAHDTAPTPSASPSPTSNTTEAAARIRTVRNEIQRCRADSERDFSPSALLAPSITHSPTAAKLLHDPVIDQLLGAAEATADGAGASNGRVSSRDGARFLRALALGRNTLVDDLAQIARSNPSLLMPDAPSKRLSFDAILSQYLEAWTRGDFVNRAGSALDAPEFYSGMDNAAINGLATVFLEALFDYTYRDLPVFFDGTKQTVVQKGWTPQNAKAGDVVTPLYVLGDQKYLFVTNDDNDEPTAHAIGAAEKKAVAKAHKQPGDITRGDLRVMRFVSELAGRQSSALTGLVVESLSDVNISVVLGASFAIGDNDTLSELIKTLGEVTSRRTTEYLVFKRLSRAPHSTPAPGVADADSADSWLQSLSTLGN